jgi:DNA-binding CsgD family transcriptional regulator
MSGHRDGRLPRGLRATRVALGSETYVLIGFERGGSGIAPALTEAEEQVALALLAGRSQAEIARLRGSAPRTVANQVASIFRKLGARSRTELAAKWAHTLSWDG